MNTPLQAQPGARLRARTVTGHKRRSQANGRTRSLRCGHASAARRAPPRAAGTSCIGSRGRSPAPGMRKAARTGRSPQGMSAKARTWSSPTPAPPAGRPRHCPTGPGPARRAADKEKETHECERRGQSRCRRTTRQALAKLARQPTTSAPTGRCHCATVPCATMRQPAAPRAHSRSGAVGQDIQDRIRWQPHPPEGPRRRRRP
jgi:hypothetical protein